MTNYIYLGYGVTDNNGKAKLEYDAQGNSIAHSYTGTGAGKVDVVASLDSPSSISDSSLRSETYELWDYLFADYINGSKNTNFTRTNVTVGHSNGVIGVYSTENGTYINNQVCTGDFEAIVQCKNIVGGGVRIGFFNATSTPNKSVRVSITDTDYYYWKFRRENGVWTVSKSSDGETWTVRTSLDQSTLTDEDCYFGVFVLHTTDTDERRIQYKNLIAYYI